MEKEEYAIIIDYLPYGYPLEKKMMPIAHAVGKEHLVLLELVPRRGVKLAPGEEVYIGEGKRDKIYYIFGKLRQEKMTENGKNILNEHIMKQIENNNKKFIDFFNTAEPMNTRLHQIELLPGFGKKHTTAIIEERKKNLFESFEDLKKRVGNLPDPKTAILKRIVKEINGTERHNLFVK